MMDKMWYYVVDGKNKAGPVPELELKNLIQQGQVQATDLVWTEGMASWRPANQIPGLIGMTPAGEPNQANTLTAASPPAASVATGYRTNYQPGGGTVPEGLVGWTKCVGILSIIYGIFQCLGCFTIPLGIIMIIAGNAALHSCKSLEQIATVDTQTLAYLHHIKKFMLMWGVTAIISIVLMIIVMVFYIAMASQYLPMAEEFMEQMQ